MRYCSQGLPQRGALFAVMALALSCGCYSPAQAVGAQSEQQTLLDSAQSYVNKGDIAAAVIQLRNAERASPQDPHVHALLAQLYVRAGDFPSAEREARSARDLHGVEGEYLPPLADSLLLQGKFADVQAQIKPGSRDPALESKVRTALAAAAMGLHDRAKAEALYREAISLDDAAPGPKIALARLLIGENVADAEKLIDAVLSANPRLPDALVVKGQVLGARGDVDGALQRFDDALAIAPDNFAAHMSRANINLSRGDFAAVDKDIDPLLKRSPQNFGANYLRALEFFKKQDFAAADAILDKISPRFSSVPEGFYVQAVTKYGLRQYGLAQDAVDKFVARFPENPYGVRLSAMIALKRNSPDLAVKNITGFLAKGTPDPATLTLLGKAYDAMNRPALALEQYQKAATLAPDNPLIKTAVAASEIDTGAGRKGLDELEKVFATDAGATVAGPTLALVDLRAGRADEAAKVAEELVKRNGDNALYQNLLALARIAQKDYPAAETILKALLDKNPDFGPARNNLAHVYLLAGQTAEAKKVYEDALARKPDDGPALLGLADVAIAEQHWDEAAQAAGKARVAVPTDPAPGLKLLDIYARQKDWTQAKALAASLAGQFSSSAEVAVAQARVLVLSGDQAGAIDAYKRAYAIAPNSPQILAPYLALLAAAKRFPDMQAVLQSRLDHDPSDQAVKRQLILVAAEIGGLDAGLAKAQGFAKTDPNNPIYDLVSAELYEKYGKSADAIGVLQKLANAHPTDDAVTIALSRLYSRGNDPTKAESVLTERLKATPDSLPLQRALGDLYIAAKRYPDAIAAETHIVDKHADDAAALNNLAWLYQQVGDLNKANEYADRAVAIAPRNGAIEDTLGWVLLARGQTDQALSHLQTASTASPSDPSIQYHFAVALDRAGRSAEARDALEKLIGSGASFSDKADAEKLLAELKRG